MSKMAKKRRRCRKWPAWQKESSGFAKVKTPLASKLNMIIHQTTINNYVIFAVGTLTVKHRIVDIAMKNIPVAAERSKTVFAWHASAADVIKE
jgi:hypothetical protein